MTHPHICPDCGAAIPCAPETCLHVITPSCRECRTKARAHLDPRLNIFRFADTGDLTEENAMRLLFPDEAAKMYNPGKRF